MQPCPEIVLDVFFEHSIKHEEATFSLTMRAGQRRCSRPSYLSTLTTTVSSVAIDYFLPLLAQSARNCACPLSVKGD
jgi:hypothetical protein